MSSFEIIGHKPTSYAVARFEIPKGMEPGRYVAHYAWNGYRDCVDIDVLPDSKPVPNTDRAIYGFRGKGFEYQRIDHCQFALGKYYVASQSKSGAAACVGGVATPLAKRTCYAIPPQNATNSHGETMAEALEACKSRCNTAKTERAGWCKALNVVPLETPPMVLA